MRPGFLVIDKSTGTRSTSCVNAVKKILGKHVNVGHGGTLDSTATGILVLLIGRATRTSGYVMALPKTYKATARFGLRTTTDDSSGEIISTTLKDLPDVASIDRAVLAFIGLRDQVPPDVSAVKVNGERAHARARRGEALNISPRPVYVKSITRTGSVKPNGEVDFLIRCHKGTYIRSIIRDLGNMLGCGAAVVSLERVSIGPFEKSKAVKDDLIQGESVDFIKSRMLPIQWISKSYTSYHVDKFIENDLIFGKKIPFERIKRVGWCESTFGNTVVLVCGKCISFGQFSLKENFPCFSPVTTIETGDVE